MAVSSTGIRAATWILALALTGTALAKDRDDDDKGDAKAEPLPLEAGAERLSFTTDEGTWISLDVTPDGEAIVFELLGDLYRLPIAGGVATPITRGMGYDSQPRVSPDGTRIAFVSDRDGADNLWISKLDGSEPRKLSAEENVSVISPTWTPDSRFVIVRVGGPRPGHTMYHVDGGSGVPLKKKGAAGDSGGDGPGSGGGVDGVGAAVSPDGRWLYYAETIPRQRRRAQRFPLAHIHRFDLRTGESDQITQAEGGGIRPALSPDGRWLAYATRYETQTGLRLRDLETGADRWLVWPIQRDAQEQGRVSSRDFLPGYAFTPDGAAVIAAYGGKIHSIDVTTGAATEIPFTAEVSLAIGPDLTAPYRVDQGPVRARIVHDPSFSPDGSRLAMSILTHLYAVDVQDLETGDDAKPERLTSGDAWEFEPVWSPDGRWIAYVTWSMNEGGQIWRLPADGSGAPEQLTQEPAFYTDLAYSPDGARIVAMRGNEYMRHQTYSEFGGLAVPLDLVWLPAAGGEVHQVMPARGARTPHFANDPTRIQLYSEDQGLFSVRFDGSDPHTVLKVTGPSGNSSRREPPAAESVRLNPKGQHALAWVNKLLWLVPVTHTGGEPATIAVRSPAFTSARLTDIGADFFGWADGGKTITWAIGSTVYQRPLDSIELRRPEKGDKDGAEAEDRGKAKRKGRKKAKGADAEPEEKREPPLDEHESVTAIRVVLEVPRATPEGTIVLSGASVLTMAGDSTAAMAEPIRDADLVVTDNRIVALGPRGSVEIPEGARVVEVDGATIVPGFIDTHAHWEFRTQDVLEPQNWSLIVSLAYGVTAGLDVQTSHKDYFAYQDLVDTGQSLGQRAFMTGPGIFGPNSFKSYEAVHAYLRRYAEHYRTRNIKSYLVGNRKQRQWVAQASKDLGLMPTTEGAGDLKLNITHAIDGMHGNEHTLTVAPLYKDVVELYAKTRTAYTPTLVVQYNGVESTEYFFTRTEVHDDPKLNRFYPHNRLDEMTRRRGQWVRDDEFNFDEAAADAAKIQRAGGLVGIGGHGEVEGLATHWEMWSLAMGGMTPIEVLRAATIDGARITGIDPDLGSLEIGKLADLVVLASDPLEDIRNTTSIRYVMKNGELYDGATLDQIWPVEKPLPRFWWWEDEHNPQRGH
ncbi:MAG: amidohydrolase family protein [Acidobacteriota bacterium]